MKASGRNIELRVKSYVFNIVPYGIYMNISLSKK